MLNLFFIKMLKRWNLYILNIRVFALQFNSLSDGCHTSFWPDINKQLSIDETQFNLPLDSWNLVSTVETCLFNTGTKEHLTGNLKGDFNALINFEFHLKCFTGANTLYYVDFWKLALVIIYVLSDYTWKFQVNMVKWV